ncbi:hypothetical protein B0T22DRAFT_524167 [Podospora appendiculata]|uniref:CFEM domain-containing protein n=1 Tax=Podospora appendiculata TaxID=314037 RepID=A0AAE0WYU1_9PEZI|nr:hypothetical protein B0T22DRAFT_524167 [Podospora appendiculata]
MQPAALLLAALSLVASASAGVATTSAPPSSTITAAPVPACTLTKLMPSCGISCVSQAAIKIGCTASMDFGCQCKSAAAMQAAVMPCVISACGPVNAPVVGSVANAICTECVHPASATATATSTAKPTTKSLA